MLVKALFISAAVLMTAACSSGSTSAPAGTASEAPVAQVKSASGSTPGNIGVLKNYFFNNYNESCEDWSLEGSTAEFLTYGECAGNPVYFWMFSDEEQRDALLPDILEKDMPLLVSDTWVIAANMDLEPAQNDIGGAINP